jgi:HPt (histidine-containing phosphotransfer) domain-containing protein
MADALDTLVVVQLRELMGDEFGAVVAAFLADSAARMKDVEQALVTADCERASRAAHALKGMCLNMGANTLSKVLSALEAAARNGDVAALPPLWQVVQNEYPKARAAAEGLVRH